MKTILIFIIILISTAVSAKNNDLLFSISKKISESSYQISLVDSRDKLIKKDTISIDIPELGLVQFVRKNFYVTHKNQQVWLGEAENKSTISLIYSKHGLSGSIIAKLGTWKIQTLADNDIKLEKFEITFPKGSTDVIDREQQQSTSKLQKSLVSPSSYNTTYLQTLQSEAPKGFTESNDIRILVYYSSLALQIKPSLEDLIELDFANANQALINSGIDASYTLAGLVMINTYYPNDPLPDMLERKGSFDRLDELRDKYDADLVNYYGHLGAFTDSFCGKAYYTTSASGWVDSRYGLSVIGINCTGGLTFAHEIGHNLGAKHDRFVESSKTIENDYAYGHVDVENQFKTIMSYDDACNKAGVSCKTITHYSNPSINYQSIPTGIDESEGNSADNASLLNKTANIVANFNGVGYPDNFVVSKGIYSNEVKLSWSAMPKADGYEIRKVKLNGTCPLFKDTYAIYNTVEETEISIPEGDEQVCYWVRAYKTYEHGAINYSAPTPVEVGYSKEHNIHISDILPQHITDQNTQLTLNFSTNIAAEINVSILDSTAEDWLEATVISLGNNQFQLLLNNTKSISASSVVVIDASGTKEYIPVQFSGYTNTAPVINVADTIVIPQNGSVTVDYSIFDNGGSDNLTTKINATRDITVSDNEGRLIISVNSQKFGSVGSVDFSAFDGELLTLKSVNIHVERQVYQPPTIPTEITLFVSNNEPLTRILPGYSIDDDVISYKIDEEPKQGSLTLDIEKNSFTYQAAADFKEDSFVLESQLSVTDDNNLPDDVYTTLVHVKPLPILQTNYRQDFFDYFKYSFLLTHRGQLWFWGDKSGAKPQLFSDGSWIDLAYIRTGRNLLILLKSDGTLWRVETYSSVDISTSGQDKYFSDPVQIGIDKDWTAIYSNSGVFGDGIFLQKADGSLWGIGKLASFFEVGNSESFESPVQVNGLYNWIGASKHEQHFYMFLNNEGEVWTGGIGNSLGRMDTNGKIAPVDIPEPVTKINGGLWRKYAHTSSGLYGWGSIFLLKDENVNYDTPVLIEDNSWSHFSVSNYNISIISSSGELYTASVSNNSPVLGRGENATKELNKVGEDTDWLASYSIVDATYALKKDGSLWVTGYSDVQYRLGLGEEAETKTFEFTKITLLPEGLLGADDTDGDGLVNFIDIDDDNDCIVDSLDKMPDVFDENGCVDSDNDGAINMIDLDDDNDSVNDVDDAFPLDPNESIDTDLDGVGNNEDTDDDGDNVNDVDDAFPLDPNESIDTDLDGVGNNEDTDDDGDNVIDSLDAYPLDASLSSLPANNNTKDVTPNNQNESSGGEGSGLILLVLFSYYLRKTKVIV
ncbi:reprolysin-like metallopeptidase [Colwellia sp. RE-S-Sl-9]